MRNFVMAGLDPAIHLENEELSKNDGCRIKSGHDKLPKSAQNL
jgi:hypothetical protein